MKGLRFLTRRQCRELAWLYFAELPDLVWFRSTIARKLAPPVMADG
jgi:hypothetical protein